MDADIACRETLLSCLKCVHTLLSFPSIHTPPLLPLLGRILHTFSPHITTPARKKKISQGRNSAADAGSNEHETAAQPPSEDIPLKLDLRKESWHNHFEAPDLTELVKRVEKTFRLFVGWLRGPTGVLDHDILVLRILQELIRLPDRVFVSAGVSHVGVFTHLPGRQQKVLSLHLPEAGFEPWLASTHFIHALHTFGYLNVCWMLTCPAGPCFSVLVLPFGTRLARNIEQRPTDPMKTPIIPKQSRYSQGRYMDASTVSDNHPKQSALSFNKHDIISLIIISYAGDGRSQRTTGRGSTFHSLEHVGGQATAQALHQGCRLD